MHMVTHTLVNMGGLRQSEEEEGGKTEKKWEKEGGKVTLAGTCFSKERRGGDVIKR